MGRLTISLSDERHLALKEAAARQHKSIREIVESSLDYYGIKTRKSAPLSNVHEFSNGHCMKFDSIAVFLTNFLINFLSGGMFF